MDYMVRPTVKKGNVLVQERDINITFVTNDPSFECRDKKYCRLIKFLHFR